MAKTIVPIDVQLTAPNLLTVYTVPVGKVAEVFVISAEAVADINSNSSASVNVGTALSVYSSSGVAGVTADRIRAFFAGTSSGSSMRAGFIDSANYGSVRFNGISVPTEGAPSIVGSGLGWERIIGRVTDLWLPVPPRIFMIEGETITIRISYTATPTTVNAKASLKAVIVEEVL